MMKKSQISGKEKKTFLTEIVFWLHLPYVLFWFGAFFIPLSLWPSRIVFHFWYISIALLIQFFGGIVLYPKTKKIDFICPLTTLMQSLRGYPVENEKNFGHSFIAELLEKLHIKISFRWVNILLIITFIIVSVQYCQYTGII